MTSSTTRSPRARVVTGLLAAGLIIAACGSDDDDTADTEASAATEAPAATEATAETAETDETDAEETEATEAPAESDAAPDTEAPEETDAPADTEAAADGVINVPDDHDTIQAAVDAASPGDLILIAPGVYNEAVNVVTDELTIRGLDRNEVILDGQFELENGIRVLGAKGVAVENMTAVNYAFNGFFWLEADGYRGSYLTAHRNGDYGIYAFDSVNGLLEHSYAAGSPDAGYYIGQCFPCNALIDDVWAEHNGLGYSGTDSGGNLTIINSQFNNNRSGIVPNSGSYELCYPERESTIIGNVVFANNQPDTPAIGNALVAHGTGITLPGGVRNDIERNYVYDHERVGIAVVPFPEENPNDDIPDRSEWDTPCEVQREQPLNPPKKKDLLFEEFLIWDPFENSVIDNVVEGSGQADLGLGTFDSPVEDSGNCFEGNTYTTTQPANLERLAPCDGQGRGNWEADVLDLVQIFTYEAPPAVDYQEAELPEIPQLDGMEDPEGAPANPAVNMPPEVDTDSIVTPTGPFYEPTG